VQRCRLAAAAAALKHNLNLLVMHIHSSVPDAGGAELLVQPKKFSL
jgi:hypothetical protein